MSPILIAIALILGGLVMARFCTSLRGILGTIVYYAGVLLVIVGLLILLFPVLAWCYKQLMDAMGIGPRAIP